LRFVAKQVAMIFACSRDGRSHAPEAFSIGRDVVAGITARAGGLQAMEL
jgi:hypothetical protein